MLLGFPISTMIAFLLVLARVAALVMFLPIPGFRAAPNVIRLVFILGLTFALLPEWPSPPDQLPTFGWLAASACAETGFGLLAGLAVGFLTEAFELGAQILSVQAGYGFASTIDPTSQADSGVLQVLLSLITGLLFFGLGIDREVIRVLAASFEKFPAGSWAPAVASLDGVLRLGGGIFAVGLRLAMPVMALLLLLDLALALLGRMQQQLQLLSLAFPVKMLAALGLLTALAPVIARVFEGSAARMVRVLWRLVS
jgi:flagellar biosynthetic protein FliR